MAKRGRDDASVSHDGIEFEETAADLVAAKYAHVDHVGRRPEGNDTVMQCLLPPHSHPLHFTTYDAYDLHYNSQHVNRCTECHRNLPTEHFLNLHIAENHDPLNEAKKARGEKTYSCFVEDCDKVCSTPQKRRMHLIDKHLFPKNYDFFVVNDGLDKRNSLLRQKVRPRRKSAISSEAVVAKSHRSESSDEETVPVGGERLQDRNGSSDRTEKTAAKVHEDDMESITKSMSALNFVPPSVRFGRGRGRSGFARR